MANAEHFDAVIFGSGQGGKLLAWTLARTGKKVAVVERQWVGGSCPAVACLPSKNEIWGARVAYLTQNAAHFNDYRVPLKFHGKPASPLRNTQTRTPIARRFARLLLLGRTSRIATLWLSGDVGLAAPCSRSSMQSMARYMTSRPLSFGEMRSTPVSHSTAIVGQFMLSVI